MRNWEEKCRRDWGKRLFDRLLWTVLWAEIWGRRGKEWRGWYLKWVLGE